MSFNLKTHKIVIAGAAFLAGASVAYAASPLQGFGPPVNGGKSLDANLGRLAQAIAWQNSPEGDVYRLALAMPAPDKPFKDAAIESAPLKSFDARAAVHNGASLNASLGLLAKVMAWQKSPAGDAFQYALEDHVKGADFQTIALASIPPGGFRTVRD